jgi:hypothetical protein
MIFNQQNPGARSRRSIYRSRKHACQPWEKMVTYRNLNQQLASRKEVAEVPGWSFFHHAWPLSGLCHRPPIEPLEPDHSGGFGLAEPERH